MSWWILRAVVLLTIVGMCVLSGDTLPFMAAVVALWWAMADHRMLFGDPRPPRPREIDAMSHEWRDIS